MFWLNTTNTLSITAEDRLVGVYIHWASEPNKSKSIMNLINK